MSIFLKAKQTAETISGVLQKLLSLRSGSQRDER
jgi:hypothetical protein